MRSRRPSSSGGPTTCAPERRRRPDPRCPGSRHSIPLRSMTRSAASTTRREPGSAARCRPTSRRGCPARRWRSAPSIWAPSCAMTPASAPRLSELAILVVARRWSARYEWAVHAVEAAKAGIPADVIAALGAGRHARARRVRTSRWSWTSPRSWSRTERWPTRRSHGPTRRSAARAWSSWSALVGYYTLVAMTLNAFEVPAPDGAPRLP